MTEMGSMMRMFRGVCKGFGTSMRTIGRSVDEVGSRLQTPFSYKESLSRHQQFMPHTGISPAIGEAVFVAPNASLIGDVTVGDKSSIWYGAVIRGDINKVIIGSSTNIQDRAIIHVASKPEPMSTKIGDMVSIGHRAIVHASTIEDESVIGMGAIVLDGCVISRHAYVAPGSVLPPKTVVKSGELWAGSPAKLIRELTDDEKEKIVQSARDYMMIAEAHLFETTKDYERIEFDRLKRKILATKTPEFCEYTGTVGLEDEQSEAQARDDLEQRRRHFGG